MSQDYSEDEPLEDTPDEWESGNVALLSQLARYEHFGRIGENPPAESFEQLCRAFKTASLLVPIEEKLRTIRDEDGDLRNVFSVMLRPEKNFDGHLMSVAFTSRDAAQTFFQGNNFHSMITSGDSLTNILLEVTRSLEMRNEEPQLAALVINPHGPHTLTLGTRDLVLLAHGGVPLDASHAMVESDSEFSFHSYKGGEVTLPSPQLLDLLRQTISNLAPSLGISEVLFFEVTIGKTPPHFGLAVASADAAKIDALGAAILEVWQRNVPSHMIFDIIGLTAKLEPRIRLQSTTLWKAPKEKTNFLDKLKSPGLLFKPRSG